MNGNLYLHVCSINSSLPQQKAFISFLSAKRNLFHNLFTSSFSFTPKQHRYTNTDTNIHGFVLDSPQLKFFCCRFKLVSLRICFSFYISWWFFMLLHCYLTSNSNCSEILLWFTFKLLGNGGGSQVQTQIMNHFTDSNPFLIPF